MSLDPSRLTELALQHAQLKPLHQAEASNPYAALQSFSGNAAETLKENAKTVRSDTLAPHQQRVVTERDEIQSRLTALQTFINSQQRHSVDISEQRRLLRQELIMIEYVAVLNERVAAFNL